MASFSVSMNMSRSGVQWQWMDDSQMWLHYDPVSSDAIEQSFLAGAPFATVSSAIGGRARRGATYNITFHNMEQVNTATGFLRNVRRDVAAGYPCDETWLWRPSSQWETVPARVCLQMTVSRDIRHETSTVAHVHPVDLVHPTAGPDVLGPSASGSRDAEFHRVIREARDCTASCEADDTCAVCIDGFSAREPALLLSNCNGHYIHATCLMDTFRLLGPKCPTCAKMYGALHGDQPDGTMDVNTHRPGAVPLSGHETVGTIEIRYHFPSGTQGPRHPNTGRRFFGTSRVAYLPEFLTDNADGRQILALLRKCFDRRMTFTVGTSVTTGRSDCVVWNGIHHKTNTAGGSASFGYPDPGYFSRVKVELAAKGIS